MYIDTHTNFVVLLGDDHYWGNPFCWGNPLKGYAFTDVRLSSKFCKLAKLVLSITFMLDPVSIVIFMCCPFIAKDVRGCFLIYCITIFSGFTIAAATGIIVRFPNWSQFFSTFS